MPVGGERVEHGQVEGERLARGGARRDDHVAAALAPLRTPRPGARRARRSRGGRALPARAGWSESGSGAVRASRAGSVARCASSSPDERGARPRRRCVVIPTIEAAPCSSTRTIFAASMPVRSAPAGATTASNLALGCVRDVRRCARARGPDPARRRRPPSRRARAGARGCRRSRARARGRALLPAARGSAASRRRRGLAEAGASYARYMSSSAPASSSASRTTGAGRRGSGSSRALEPERPADRHAAGVRLGLRLQLRRDRAPAGLRR